MRKRSNSAIALYVFMLVAAILKLCLVSDLEILARFQPLDDLWQVNAAARSYWFARGYDWMMYVRLPVYPLWMRIVQATGLPLRLGIELTFIASALVFALTLVRCRIPRAVAALVYSVIVFHPASFDLFNYTLAETLYAPALLLALSALILLWESRHDTRLAGRAVWAGIGLALLWHVRPEAELVTIILAGFGVAAAFALWREGARKPEMLRFLKLAIVVPGIIIFIAATGLKAANRAKIGLFVSTEMSSPGYLAAYKALLRIKPEHSIRFIPVTREARARAYAVSPAFRELKPYIEGDNFGSLETFRSIGVENEIAAGWFYWILRQAVAAAGHGGSAVEMNAFFQRIADELGAAQDAGTLASRLVWSQFIDPDAANYLPHLPESLAKICAVFVADAPPPRETEDAVEGSTRRAFDIAANRRSALIAKAPTTISGWVLMAGTEVKRLGLQKSDGSSVANVTQFSARPDVAGGYRAAGTPIASDNLGFSFDAALAGDRAGYALVVEGSDGVTGTLSLDRVVVGQGITFESSNGHDIVLAIDRFKEPRAREGGQRIRNAIWSIYARALQLSGYLGIAAFFIMALLHRRMNIAGSIYLVIWMLAIAVASRALLFAVLDASSWPGNQVRYLFPAMQLYAPLLILLLYGAGSLLRARIAGRPRISATPQP